jgi:hypothetical protein
LELEGLDLSKLTSVDDGFYMADSFDRDVLFCCAPQGTSSAITASTAAYDGIASLSSAINNTKVSCDSITSSIDKVNNAIKQLSKKLGVSLNADGDIVEEHKVSHWNRLKRSDLLTLGVRG